MLGDDFHNCEADVKGRESAEIQILNAKARRGSEILYLDKHQVTMLLEHHFH